MFALVNMSSWTLIISLYFLFGIHGKIYRKSINEVNGKVWPKYVYKNVANPLMSDVQCGAACRIGKDDGCNFYIFFKGTCYLGVKGTPQFVMEGRPDPQKIMLDSDQVAAPNDFLLLALVNDSTWTKHIFDVIIVQSLDECVIRCIEDLQACDIYVVEGNICYLGQGWRENGTAIPSTSGPWNVHALPHAIDTIDNYWNGRVAKGILVNVSGSEWSTRIYKVMNDVNSNHICSGHCTFSIGECHFYTYNITTKECFLGNYKETAPVISEQGYSVTAYGVTITSWIKRHEHFPFKKDDNLYEVKNYKVIESVRDTDHCAGYCILDNGCQFFAIRGGSCHLCNFNVTTPFLKYSYGVSVKQFLKKGAASEYDPLSPDKDLFFKLYMPAISWCQDIEEFDSAPTLEDNDYVAYRNGICYIGKRHSHQKLCSFTNGWDDVYVKKASMQSINWQLVFDVETGVPSSSWSNYVYSAVEIQNLTSSLGAEECKIQCYYDRYPCYGYLYDHPTCYKTALITNTSFVTSASNLDWYQSESNIGLITGGYDRNGTVDSTISVVKDMERICYQNQVPKLLELTTFGTPMVFLNPYLIISGGLENDTNAIISSTYMLDLSKKGLLKWNAVGKMNQPRAFHELVILDSSTILALGGRGLNGDCLNDAEFLDISNGTWQVLPWLSLPVPREHFCAQKHDNYIYIMGGYDCNSGELLDDFIVVDLTTQSYTFGSSLPFGLHSFACGLRAHPEINSQENIIEILGGQGQELSENTTSLSNMTFRISLTNINGGWNNVRNISLHMSMIGSSSKIMYLSKTNNVVSAYIFPGFTLQKEFTPLWLQVSSSTHISWDDSHSQLLYPRAYPAQAVLPSEAIWHCSVDWTDWVLVMRQTRNALFSDGQWSVNSGDPTADPFSVMNMIENYRSPCDGMFHFRLVWSGLNFFNEWKQSSNPYNTTSVQGYQEIAVGYTLNFSGLKVSDDVIGLLTSEDNSPQRHYTLGRKTMPSEGIPGPRTQAEDIYVHEQLLYARMACN